MKSLSVSSKVIVVLAFTLTMGSLLIAGFYVPSIEELRENKVESVNYLGNIYTLESQRYNEHGLNLSASAQILASKRILQILAPGKNVFTRNALLTQGRLALIRGLTERRKAISKCIAALDSIDNTSSEYQSVEAALPLVPIQSITELFADFENKSEVIKTMQNHVMTIQNVDEKYEKVWERIINKLRNEIQKLNLENSALSHDISFFLKLALSFQVLAMLLVFLKDFLGENIKT